jgi:hypothetical protein
LDELHSTQAQTDSLRYENQDRGITKLLYIQLLQKRRV